MVYIAPGVIIALILIAIVSRPRKQRISVETRKVYGQHGHKDQVRVNGGSWATVHSVDRVRIRNHKRNS